MNKFYRLALIYAAMGMMFEPDMKIYKQVMELTDEEKEEIRLLKEKNSVERLLKRGCKKWTVNSIEVIALNKKNAIRKAKNIQKLINELEN